MSELASRLMKKFHNEDGAAAASGSAGAASGASVTGNAGLSSLGAVPNGAVGILGTKKKHRECKSCGYITQHENVKICYECGNKLPRINERSLSERLADYRTEQILLDKSNVKGFDWINGAVDVIMNMMRTGYPNILNENDDLANKELNERVKNMLHGYEMWRINREGGNLF